MSMFRNLIAQSSKKPSRLPDAYQEVEYITGTGTQYINTRYYAYGSTTGVEMYVENVTNTCCIFGVSGGSWSSAFDIYITANTNFYLNYWGSYLVNTKPPEKMKVKTQGGKFYLDDILIYSTSSKERSTLYPMYLMSCNWNGAANYTMKGKFGYAKIFENDILKKYYIPCYRKADGVIGVYEMEAGEFLTNAGTGTFEKGGDV